jgi:hypothetical protein
MGSHRPTSSRTHRSRRSVDVIGGLGRGDVARDERIGQGLTRAARGGEDAGVG